MQRVFLRNLAFLLVINLLVKPFWILGVNVGVQNAVGPEAYGIYFAVLNLSYILQVFLDLGIHSYNSKSIAENPLLYSKHLGNMALLKIVLGFAFFVVLFAVGYGFLQYRGLFLKLLSLVGINVFLSSFLLFLRSNLAGLHLFKWDSIASVADRILMIIFCGVLLISYKHNFSIEWFVLAQLLSYIMVIIAIGIVLAKKAQRVEWNVNTKLLKRIIKSSLPFALLNLLMAAYTRLDGVMLEYLLPNGNFFAGVYAQGFKFYEATIMIAFLFAGLLLPIFAKQLAKKESILPVVGQSSEALLIPVFILATATFFQAEAIAKFLFSHEIQASADVLKYLILGLVPVAVGYIYGTLLTANNNLKFLNISSFLGLIANIGLNFILIPKYAAKGAAIATLLTQALVLGAQFLFAAWLFKIKLSLKYSLKLSLVLILIVFIGLVISEFWPGSIFFWMLHILSGLILALSFRILNVKQAINLLK